MDYREQSLGAIAIAMPRATTLFRQYDLDFCCGGKQTLRRAADKKALNLDTLVAQLDAIANEPNTGQDWEKTALNEVTPFIVKRYHDRHREQLPELILMAAKVERVHHEKPACPKGLASQLEAIYNELSQHMMKEEQILFPMIEQGMGPRTAAPISVMEHEHDAAGAQLEEVKRLTNNVTPPVGACNTWQALYGGINEFIDDLMNHIHLENNILFPRALRGE